MICQTTNSGLLEQQVTYLGPQFQSFTLEHTEGSGGFQQLRPVYLYPFLNETQTVGSMRVAGPFHMPSSLSLHWPKCQESEPITGLEGPFWSL